MSSEPIFFQFGEDADTKLAMDTLEELGYHAGLVDYDGETTLHVHVENQDLASALQIVQACGGNLVEITGGEEVKLYDTIYSMDTVQIPAHIVNEDLASQNTINTLASDEDVNGFDAGIHL